MTSYRPLPVVAALILLLLVPTDASAWSAGGHRIIALIAFRQLPGATRAKLVKILKAHPHFDTRFKRPESVREADYDAWLFTQAGVWPDLIRGREPWDHPTWHYVNEPYFLSDADRLALKYRSINSAVSPSIGRRIGLRLRWSDGRARD